MTRRWLVNLALLLVLGLVGLLIRQEWERLHLIPTLGGGLPEPQRIEIAREGEPLIRLERLASGWHMREPFAVDADAQRVAELLTMRNAPLMRTLPARMVAMSELGLDPARLRVRFDTVEWVVGGVDPLAQWRYLAHEDLVHLVPDVFYHRLIAPAIDLVARGLLPRDAPPVFATRDAVPLDQASLQRIGAVEVERVEAMIADASDLAAGVSLVELNAMDGTRFAYLVSSDGRRWVRPDLRLTYVLSEGPELVEDPQAIDPTPSQPFDTLFDSLGTAPALGAPLPGEAQEDDRAWSGLLDPEWGWEQDDEGAGGDARAGARADASGEDRGSGANEGWDEETGDADRPVLDPDAELEQDPSLEGRLRGGDPGSQWGAPAPLLDEFSDPFTPAPSLIDPDAPLSDDLPLGPPPEVRLRPFPIEPWPEPDQVRPGALPNREVPAGFGTDPFAPDDTSP